MSEKKEYDFGGIKDFNLEEIESEILNDSVYLDVFAGSDIAFKKEISPLKESLSKINEIDCFEYYYKTEEFPEKGLPNEKQAGVMAQELEKVYPMAVKTDTDGLKYVNYNLLTPLLINSIKELTGQVNTLQSEIKKLRSDN